MSFKCVMSLKHTTLNYVLVRMINSGEVTLRFLCIRCLGYFLLLLSIYEIADRSQLEF